MLRISESITESCAQTIAPDPDEKSVFAKRCRRRLQNAPSEVMMPHVHVEILAFFQEALITHGLVFLRYFCYLLFKGWILGEPCFPIVPSWQMFKIEQNLTFVSVCVRHRIG